MARSVPRREKSLQETRGTPPATYVWWICYAAADFRKTAFAGEPVACKELVLGQARELEQFLASVERRAFRIARIALRHDDDALDAVQDAMLKLARNYATRPVAEWPPLFYRILQNRVRDGQRRRQVRNRLFAWLPTGDDDEAIDPVAAAPSNEAPAVDRLMADEAMQRLEEFLGALPARQQEAFMLRNFEGLDVAQTASAMGCSEGSVKTHYSRAVHTLREKLGDAW
jgi:RNA polymerase sigma-70 factor (ECF subfamily)